MIIDTLPATSRGHSSTNRERFTYTNSSKSAKSSKKYRNSHNSRYPTHLSHDATKDQEAEKVVYNTWLDKVHEASTFQGPELSAIEQYKNDKQLDNQRDKVRDYEEILQDSPINSYLQQIDGLNHTEVPSDLVNEGSENVEEILNDISELSKKVPQVKKGIHKRGFSHILEPIKAAKSKKFTHLASLIMEPTPEIDSLYRQTSDRGPQKFFGRLDGRHIHRFYTEVTKQRSSLSQILKSADGTKTRELTIQNGVNKAKKKGLKSFHVYFFNTKLYLDIHINIYLTVGEVIKQIIECYNADKTVDHSLLKYPKEVDAYELRMLDDEDADYMDDGDAHMPDFSLPPLEKNRVFASLGLEKGVAFVENSDFKPPQEIPDKQPSKFQMMEKIATLNNKILVTIHGSKEKFVTTCQIAPEKKIKDLYPHIAVRIKTISERYHKFRLYRGDPSQNPYGRDHQNDDDDDDETILDVNMPLKALKTKIPGSLELEVVRKKFTDEPEYDPFFLRSSLFGNAEMHSIRESLMEENEGNNIIMYNGVTASRLEEFEVLKIKKHGKCNVRILGIDGFRIYNTYKQFKEQNAGLANVFSNLFFTKIAPKHPEFLMADVLEARIVSGSRFMVTFLNDYDKRKNIEYEANDVKTAHRIVAKIQYLKNSGRNRNN